MAEDIFKKTSGKWVKVPGKLKDISVGVNAVWGANKLNDIYMKTEKSGWKRITGKLMQVRVVIICLQIQTLVLQVSVSGSNDSVVWGVAPNKKIYRWTGSKWENVAGGLVMVSCGDAGVWGVWTDNSIFYRRGTYGGVIA